MASRKNLKKVITYIADQLATQAFFASYNTNADAAEWAFFTSRRVVPRSFASSLLCQYGMKEFFYAVMYLYNRTERRYFYELSEVSESIDDLESYAKNYGAIGRSRDYRCGE